MGPGMEVQVFERKSLFGRRWYFRLVDTRNWETLSTSEGYNSARARNETAKRIAETIGCQMMPERRKARA